MTSQLQNLHPGDGTVGKALAILDMVADIGRPVRFSTLLDASPHPKATLYRLLQTLTNQGMLRYDEEQQTYALGLRLVRLAHQAWRQSSLAPIARPFLDCLASEVGETVHLAQMDNGQVLYVDKRTGRDPIEMFSQAGKVGPGYCTGVGKAIMAFLNAERQADAIHRQAFYPHTPNTLTTPEMLKAELETIRAAGVSYDREEHEPGIICIAVPILTGTSSVIGGLSITTSTQRRTLTDLEGLLPHMRDTARSISQAAMDWHFPNETQ